MGKRVSMRESQPTNQSKGNPDMKLEPQVKITSHAVNTVQTKFMPRHLKYASLAAVTLLTASACGGGSGGGDNSTPQSSDDAFIIGGTEGNDASALNDDQLRRTAASSASAGLGVNLDNLSNMADIALVNMSDDDASVDASGDTAAIDSLNVNSNSFVFNSSGIDDPGVKISRQGNIMTIDPDDQTLCSDEIPLADGMNDDQSVCQQLAADLTVQVDARSDTSGIITYFFQNTPVLLVSYSPMGASYEARLDGLQLVIARAKELDGTVAQSMLSMSGAIRLSATVLSDEPAKSAGSLSLTVTDALSFGQFGEQPSISLEPSTIFSVAFDESTGDVSSEVDWGALQVVAQAGGEDQADKSTTVINLGGLSAELSFNENAPALRVSNIGIGNVPLTVTVNSIESVNLTLAKFGISVNQDTRAITLDGALNANLMLNNLAQILEQFGSEYTASASVSVPANSVLVPQDNGSTLFSSGGPLEASLIANDDTSAGQNDVSINAGECFGPVEDNTQNNAVTALLSIIACQ